MPPVGPEAWTQLGDLNPPAGELTALPTETGSELLLARDHLGTRHLLIPLASESDGCTDDRTRGLKAATRRLVVQGQPERPYIDVICVERSGYDAFNVVVSEIQNQVNAGMAAAEAVLLTLARWRRFWAAVPEAGLGPEEIRALFGELWFLAVWLLPREITSAGNWVGPTGARHDFQWLGLAIEVKTTASVHGHVHWIHGIDQLEPPSGGRLYLFSLRLRDEQSAANSLVTVIDRVRHSLQDRPDLMDQFDTRLAQAGYSPAHAGRYRAVRFRVIDERIYRVADGFPRILPNSLPNGVPAGIERVYYEINLAACPQLSVADSPTGLGTIFDASLS